MASVSVLPPVVIGIDLGTSSAKAVAFDQRGTAVASRSTEVALHTDGDRAEQDQHALLEAVVEATALALDVPRSIPMTTGGRTDTDAIVGSSSGRAYSRYSRLRPMSQSMGGHRPTNKARRSALPRSSWSTVLARIHSVLQMRIEASEPM